VANKDFLSACLTIAQVIVQAGNKPGISYKGSLMLSETQGTLDEPGTLLPAKSLPRSKFTPSTGKGGRTPTIIRPDTRSGFKNIL